MEGWKISVSHKECYTVEYGLKYEAGTAGIIFFRQIYGNCIIAGCRDASHSTTPGWSGHPLRGAAHPDDYTYTYIIGSRKQKI